MRSPRTPIAIVTAVALVALLAVLNSAGAGVSARLPGAFAAAATDAPYRLGFASTAATGLLRADLEDGVVEAAVAGRARDGAAALGALAWIGPAAGGDGSGELFYREASPSDPAGTQLTDGGFVNRTPAVSPDRTRIAFESDRAGNPDIWVINVDGTGLARVTDDPAPQTWPAWSPDGTELVYASFGQDTDGDIYRVSAGGGTPVRLTDSPGADIEPAWVPGQEQISFTTTRLRPEGDVVRMPAAGGEVTKVLPEPWAASQGSWSPDGARFAFVTRQDDPQGDVYLFADGTVTALANVDDEAELRPTQDTQAVYYTRVGGSADGFDVWTAAPDGGDRVGLTGRPGLDETAPAWTLDGRRLAYVEEQPGGGRRIVVADADGGGRRMIAPAGTLADDRDDDPTWSPDGSMLAFTRTRSGPGGTSTQEVVIVRVADSAELGRIPAPPGLTARDTEPAWSPDGVRLAFRRTLQPVPTPVPEVPPADVPVPAGTQLDVPARIAVPPLPSRPDIVFLVDATGGMETVHDLLAAEIGQLMFQVRAQRPEAQFALVTYTRSGHADVFRVRTPLTTNLGTVSSAMALTTTTGLAGPNQDDWINALHGVLTGRQGETGSSVISFRSDGTPIVVLVGDSSSAEPSFGHRITEADGSPGDTLRALVDARARVVAVTAEPNTPTSDGGLDSAGQVTALADATSGVQTHLNPGPGAAIEALLERGIREVPITVTAEPECEPGLTVTVTPPSRTVVGGGTAAFTQTVAVAADATPGATLRCRVSYLFGDGTATVQPIEVRVGDGATPLVRVDDVTVTTDDPAGSEVDYTAAAVTAGGDALEVACVPESGSRFPVGHTLVTCSATDGAGNTGTDTAVVTVIDPAMLSRSTGSTAHVWAATLAFPAPDRLVVTAVENLSHRTGGPCAGADDTPVHRYPTWSPDATRIAYVADSDTICAVGSSDGALAGVPLPEAAGLTVADPAWSPDGTLIAFGEVTTEGPTTRIWTVPVAGGEPTLVIGSDPAGAGTFHQEPAFRVIAPEPPPGGPTPTPTGIPGPGGADLSLTVSAAPRPAYLDGDGIVVRYTVRNATADVAMSVRLVPELPDELPVATADRRCASAGACDLGILLPGAQATRTFRLEPAAALRTRAIGTATGTRTDGRTATATGAAPVEVVAPELSISPEVGPPGRVAIARGGNFPPGAVVRLTWRDGITERDNTVTVAPDGSFRWQALVFRRDALGARVLRAERVRGSRFGAVSADFLVVPRSLQPPQLVGRG